MIYENWFEISSKVKSPYCPPLDKNITTECLVIGGCFAGLHAALTLANAGKEVVLLEKRFCGGGSSGKSAGFLTHESEKDVDQLIKVYGEKKAKALHEIPKKGVDLILKMIKKNFDFHVHAVWGLNCAML